MITNYHISHLEDYEDFLNKLFAGLSYYKKKCPNMTFRITYSKDTITLKTTMLPDGSSN